MNLLPYINTRLFYALFFLSIWTLSSSCKKDEPVTPKGTDPILLMCGELDLSRTLTNDPDRPIDYLVGCNMKVNADLVIEPGVVMAFKAGTGLDITGNGSINAVGTASEPILFTGEEKVKGSWAGIMVQSSSPLNKLQFVTVEYGGLTGHWPNGISGNVSTYVSARLIMNNSRLNKSFSYGLNTYHHSAGSDVTLNENTYRDNQIPLRVGGKDVWIPSPTDDYTGNVESKVEIVLSSAEISQNTTWRKINVPYKITGNQNLSINANLIIEPGTIIEMGQNTGINVNEDGGLKIAGLPQDRIIIRGELGIKGSWHKIFYKGSNVINEIGYADILHGGQDLLGDPGTIYTWYNARLHIHDVHFEELNNCAIAYRTTGGQTFNPNLTYANLTFTNVGCEFVEY
jgi:hypothetical protein